MNLGKMEDNTFKWSSADSASLAIDDDDDDDVELPI